MEIQRYIPIVAINKNNILIPIWDESIVFNKSKDCGMFISLKNDTYKHYYELVDGIFDLKTKKILTGIELNEYPDLNKLEHAKGDLVLFEKSHRQLQEATIVDIVFEEYDLNITKGSKIDKWTLEKFKDTVFQLDSLYSIKQWKPFYILDNGVKIEWEHQLYKKV